MPLYDYECLDCLAKNADTQVFLAKHGMFATEEEIRECTICPDCGGSNTRKAFSVSQHLIVKTSDWREYKRKNKEAIARDRDLHLLKNGQDPFASHRTPGETADVIDKLEQSKKAKPKRQYFT